MNLRILVLKRDKLSSFLRPGSNLFHSIIVDGKNEYLKKWWFVLRRGVFSGFLIEYNVRLTGIKEDIEDVNYLRLYKEGKVFCTNDETEGTENKLLDVFSLLKNP